MTWPIVIELAGPPRGKGAGRSAPNHPGVYQDAKTRSYEAQLRFAAQQAMAGAQPTAQPVDVEVVASMQIAASWSPRKRNAAILGQLRPAVKPDANNFSKALDALNGIVWVDDRQIVRELIIKRYAKAPSLRITVRPVDPPVALPVVHRRPSDTDCADDLLAALV